MTARCAVLTAAEAPERRVPGDTVAEPLEVLGAFRPAGSPFAAYYPDGTPAGPDA